MKPDAPFDSLTPHARRHDSMKRTTRCRAGTAAAATLALLLAVAARADIVISGVGEELERNVRAFVALADESCDIEGWRLRRQLRAARVQTRRALEPFGYYDPVIDTTLSTSADCWRVDIAIEPGARVRYRNVDIRLLGEAADDPAFDAYRQHVPIRPGEALDHASYDAIKRSASTLAAERGYIDAEFTENTIDVWPDDVAADVTLHYNSGRRYRLGAIDVEQDIVEDRIVFGYLDLEQGAPFSSDDLVRAQRDLIDSAYFDNVEVVADTENAVDGEIPIRISVTPGTRIEYTIGAGASTDIGARFRAGYRNNRINRRGHRAIADLNYSPVVQAITTEYRIPLGDPRREWFSLNGAVSVEEPDTFRDENQRLGVRWTETLGDRWLRTLFVDASNSTFDVGNENETSRFIVPGIVMSQKVSDSDTYPTRGHRLDIEFYGTDASLGSSTGFVKATLFGRLVRSFGRSSRVLARVGIGALQTEQFERLPPSLRFFAGGDESIRGFDYDTLGPLDEEGNVIGGSRLLTASLEVERRLRGNFYGAVFVDAGNAFNDTDIDTQVGTGVGLKWRSPVGPVRIYIGFPVSESDANPRLHLRLGGDL